MRRAYGSPPAREGGALETPPAGIWKNTPFGFTSCLSICMLFEYFIDRTRTKNIYQQIMDSPHFDKLALLSQRRLAIAYYAKGRRLLIQAGERRAAHSFNFQVTTFFIICATLARRYQETLCQPHNPRHDRTCFRRGDVRSPTPPAEPVLGAAPAPLTGGAPSPPLTI